MLPPDGQFRFGRVISTAATIGPMRGIILIYIYRFSAPAKTTPDLADLGPDRLLLPPMMTNRKGWTLGLFETVDHAPLRGSDLLNQHCFRRSNGDYYDDQSKPLDGPTEPVGDYGLHSYRTIDDALSDALGFDRVPD